MMNWLKKLMLLILVKLLTKQDYDAKTKDIEDVIPNIKNLATTAALTAVENKISNVSTQVKKAYHDAKIKDIEKNIFMI